MTVRVYPSPNQTATGGPANDPVHRTGHDVDHVDQVSSPVLLGFAVAGAALVVAANLLIM